MLKHLVASVVTASLLFAAGSARANPGDDMTATVIAERRALKPGAGLYVVDTTIDVRVGDGTGTDAKGNIVHGGWRPASIEFDLWGKSDSANAIAVKWKDGSRVITTSECESPDIDETKEYGPAGQWRDQEKVHCNVKGDLAVNRTGAFDAEIYLRVAGKPEQLLRKVSFAVFAAKENDTPNARVRYYVDRDYKLAETVGYWQWDGSSLHVRTYVKTASEIQSEGKLRCTMNGAPFAKEGTVSPGGGMGLAVTGPNAAAWTQLEGMIDLPRASGKWQPGKYECQMVVSAKVMRTIRFQLDAKLALVTSSEQQGPGAIASRTTYLPDFDIPSGIDLPFSRTAFTTLALSGRPWKGGPPAAVASSSNIALATSAPGATPAAAPAKSAPPAKAAKKGKPTAKPKKTAKR